MYCRNCTVNGGFACTFQLQKTAEPISDANKQSDDAMEVTDKKLLLDQWYWYCNMFQKHLEKCTPLQTKTEGASQAMYSMDMLTEILVPYVIQAQENLTAKRIKNVLKDYLQTPAANQRVSNLKKKLWEVLTGSKDVNIRRMVRELEN